MQTPLTECPRLFVVGIDQVEFFIYLFFIENLDAQRRSDPAKDKDLLLLKK